MIIDTARQRAQRTYAFAFGGQLCVRPGVKRVIDDGTVLQHFVIVWCHIPQSQGKGKIAEFVEHNQVE